MLTYSQRLAWSRIGNASINSTIDAAMQSVAAQQNADRDEAIAAYKICNAPIPFSAEQLKAATVIRTKTGWHRVVKVNAKTVTVATDFSWTDRHDIAKILEVRAA